MASLLHLCIIALQEYEIMFSSPLPTFWKSLQQSSALLDMSQAKAELRVREQETTNRLKGLSI